MNQESEGGLRSALAWFLFPLVPALLGRTYYQVCNFSGSDPRDWPWMLWVLALGPLVGYGFLAGTTMDLADDPERRGIRSWLSRRALWVGIGPWIGLPIGVGLLFILRPLGLDGSENAAIVCVAIVASGWLLVASAAIRRARRMGRARRAVERGLAVALGFVGSLLGSFWAITEAWRTYFFDARIVPFLIAAASLALAAGCDATPTYGQVRRRELFSAMLTAWLVGLALAWRWWSRKGRGRGSERQPSGRDSESG